MILQDPQCLKTACQDFENVVVKLSTKQKSETAFKYICDAYRLLENPKWKEAADPVLLCLYTSHLCRYIKELQSTEVPKYLAVVCNIHRYISKKSVPVNACFQLSEYVLKNPSLELTREQTNVYWLLLVDKLTLIESSKCQDKYIDYIPNILENIVLILKFYAIVDFCQEKLPWLIRRLFLIFNPTIPKELDATFEKIFKALSENQRSQESICEGHVLSEETYKKLLFCFIFINQNIANCEYHSNDSFAAVLKFSMNLFESIPSYFHHMQALWIVFPTLTTSIDSLPPYSHSFISDFIEKLNLSINLKYTKPLQEFCLIFKKILTLSISNWVKVSDECWKKNMPIKFQIQVLSLTKLIAKVLSQSDIQSAKCANCNFKSGIHDSFQLACFARQFTVNSSKNNMNISNLVDITSNIARDQLEYLRELFTNQCPNWGTFWTKIETDLHNDAISLYSLNQYEHSQSFFKLYTSHASEILAWSPSVLDMNHLSRVYYNLAICQFDLTEYFSALKSCYLSMAISTMYKLKCTEEVPHFNFILRVKAKVTSLCTSEESADGDKPSKSKCFTNEYNQEEKSISDRNIFKQFHNLTIWTVCRQLETDEEYKSYVDIFSNVNYAKLLLGEIEVFTRNWLSSCHLGGICKSIQKLCEFTKKEKKPLDELTVLAGKAITLISYHANKFNNPDLKMFIKYTAKLLESLLEEYQTKSKPLIHIGIVKILMANTLQALYECEILEKREAQKLTVTTSVFNTPRAAHEPVPHPDDACDVIPTQQYLLLAVENDILKSLLHSVQLWREVAQVKDSIDILKEDVEFKLYLDKTVELIHLVTETLALHDLEVQSLQAADVAYTIASITDNRYSIIRSIGFIIGQTKAQNPLLEPLILKTDEIIRSVLIEDDESPVDASKMDAVFYYLLSVATYYFHCNLRENGIIISTFVHNRIRCEYLSNSKDSKRKFEDIKCSYLKLLTVEILFASDFSGTTLRSEESVSILSTLVNTHVECSEWLKTVDKNQGRVYIATLRLWLEASVEAGRTSLSLGLPRRARALLRSPLAMAQRLLLSRRSAHILLLLAQADLVAERHDDCKVKLDGIRYIIDEANNSKVSDRTVSEKVKKPAKNSELKATRPKEKNIRITEKQYEMVLDVPTEKYYNKPGSPIFQASPFVMPEFIDHSGTCDCCKCMSVSFYSSLVSVIHMEAQLHFKSGQITTAQNYFNGGIKLLKYLHCRLKYISENVLFINCCCKSVIEHLQRKILLTTECQFLIDVGFQLISAKDEKKALTHNLHVLEKLQEYQADSFLVQFAHEQNMYLKQSKIFEKDWDNRSDLDAFNDLQKDFSLKMVLTPEKNPIDPSLLKTPSNRNINSMKDAKKSAVKSSSLFTRKREVPEITRPAIKLNLDDDDDDIENIKKPPLNRTKQTLNIEIFPDEMKVLKTPAPKLKSTRSKLLPLSENKVGVRTRAVGKTAASATSSSSDKESSPGSPLIFQTPAMANRLRVYKKKSKP